MRKRPACSLSLREVSDEEVYRAIRSVPTHYGSTGGMLLGVDAAAAGGPVTHYSVIYDGTSGKMVASNPFQANVTGQYTISAWIKKNGGDGKYTAMFDNRYSANDGIVLFLDNSSGALSYVWNPLNATLSGSTDLRDNTWHHVAAVSDPAGAGTARIYVDGSFVNSAVMVAPYLAADTNGSIGFVGFAALYCSGQQAETAVFSAALTGAQIAALAVGSTDPGTLSPQALWRFTEDAGTSVADASGNGYTGTLSGGATWDSSKPSVLS